MNLSKIQKFLIGIFTFLPFVLIPYLLVQILTYVFGAAAHESTGMDDVFTGIFFFLIPILLLGFLSISLLIFYVIHAAMNPELDNSERLVWILLFLFVGVIIYPFYLFLKITVAEEKKRVWVKN